MPTLIIFYFQILRRPRRFPRRAALTGRARLPGRSSEEAPEHQLVDRPPWQRGLLLQPSDRTQVAITVIAVVQGGHRLRWHNGERGGKGRALQRERVEVDRLWRISQRRRGVQQVEPRVGPILI